MWVAVACGGFCCCCCCYCCWRRRLRGTRLTVAFISAAVVFWARFRGGAATWSQVDTPHTHSYANGNVCVCVHKVGQVQELLAAGWRWWPQRVGSTRIEVRLNYIRQNKHRHYDSCHCLCKSQFANRMTHMGNTAIVQSRRRRRSATSQ